jgi:glutaminyl-tRNA synthetase
VKAEIRLYDRLFVDEDPGGYREKDFTEFINPNSLKVIPAGLIESSIRGAKPYDHVQFERNGYFCVDPDSSRDLLIFNRTVTLRDTWSKLNQKGGG